MKETLGFTASYYLWEIKPFDDLCDVTDKQFKDSQLAINQKSVGNTLSWIRGSSNRKKEEAEERFHAIADDELLEIIDLFDISADDIYHVDEETLRENEEVELALTDWFVRLDGASPYVDINNREKDAR